MSDHGYDAVQQVGLLLLLKVNAIEVPRHFSHEKDANDWLKDSTQKMLRLNERWSPQSSVIEMRLAASRDSVITAATLLGMVKGIKPDFTKLGPFQAVIPGAFESRVAIRCVSAVNDIKKNLSLITTVFSRNRRTAIRR